MSELTQARLQELVMYNPETGLFCWRMKRKGITAGKQLGTGNGFGYLRITVDGVSRYAHRLAWLYVNGELPANHIDHINGNRSDNRIANLRVATPSANQENRRGAQANSKTGLIGVSWHKRAAKWQAHITVKRVRKYLGLFDKPDDAHNAYMAAKRQFHEGCTI